MNILEREFKKALREIGDIVPWWSEKDGMYLFEHPAYPAVDYLHDDPEVVKERYRLVLKEFIEDRLNGRIAPVVERQTSGHGGKRPGAGRPKGSIVKEPTATIRLPQDLVNWLKSDPRHIEQVRKLMA